MKNAIEACVLVTNDTDEEKNIYKCFPPPDSFGNISAKPTFKTRLVPTTYINLPKKMSKAT